jgi:hypothetical protein
MWISEAPLHFCFGMKMYWVWPAGDGLKPGGSGTVEGTGAVVTGEWEEAAEGGAATDVVLAGTFPTFSPEGGTVKVWPV